MMRAILHMDRQNFRLLRNELDIPVAIADKCLERKTVCRGSRHDATLRNNQKKEDCDKKYGFHAYFWHSCPRCGACGAVSAQSKHIQALSDGPEWSSVLHASRRRMVDDSTAKRYASGPIPQRPIGKGIQHDCRKPC